MEKLQRWHRELCPRLLLALMWIDVCLVVSAIKSMFASFLAILMGLWKKKKSNVLLKLVICCSSASGFWNFDICLWSRASAGHGLNRCSCSTAAVLLRLCFFMSGITCWCRGHYNNYSPFNAWSLLVFFVSFIKADVDMNWILEHRDPFHLGYIFLNWTVWFW